MKDEYAKPRPVVAVSPAVTLGIALAVAVALLLLPARWTAPLKGAAAAALRPGQQVALVISEQANRVSAAVKRHFRTAGQLAEAQQEVDRLEGENRRLAAQLAAAKRPARPVTEDAGDDAERLLVARCVKARVLGRQARAFLARHEILDAGSRAGVEPDALVVDPPPALIDRGSDADLAPGRLVLEGSRVWGKVVEVGPYTSSVLGVTEPGYRDVVRLAGPGPPGKPPRLGPEGILEGTGQPLARVRMIAVNEPIEVGDLVYTAAAGGVLPEPLRYGRVVRLERPVGAAHWEIWMEPAAAGNPDQVAVLRVELNPLRVSSRQRAAGSGQPVAGSG